MDHFVDLSAVKASSSGAMQEEWELRMMEDALEGEDSDEEDGRKKVDNPMNAGSGGNARAGGRQYKRQNMNRNADMDMDDE